MKFLGRIFSFVLSGITACMLGFALFFSLITGFGKGLPDMAVEGFMQRFPETWSSVEIRVFLIALILLFVGFVFLAFAWIDRAGHRKRLLMFLIFGGVFLVMQLFIAFGLHTIQNTDAFEVQDQALAIARGIHQIVDYTKSTYFAKYGNNDLYLIFCVQVFRGCILLHIHAYRTVFAVLNVAAVDLGIFMTWRTVFLLKGPKAALKVFVLSVFNPLNILLICWPYTCTLSMPLMMLSLWMAAALLKGKDSGTLHFVEFLVIGLTVVTAYYFRPTAAFPVIALVLCGVCAGVQKLFCRPEMSSGDSQKSASGSGQMPAGTRIASSVMKQTNVQLRESSPYTMGKSRKLRNLVRKGILAVCVILLMAVTSSAIRSASLRLDPVTDTQFPTVYWLMLGASETGRVNSEDMNYNRRMYTEKENREADIAAVRQILKERGLAGNVKHYLEKTGLTWSDGTAEYLSRSTGSENSLPWLYQLLNGPGAGILSLWCQAYRMVMLLMALAGILVWLCSGRKSGCAGNFVFQVCVITLLGGFVFYTFWEGKPVYSYPFLPYLILVSLPAWEKAYRVYEGKYQDAPSSAKTIRRVVLVVLLAVTGLGLFQKYVITAASGVFDIPSIVCDSTALADWVSVPEGQTLTQSFYPSGAFNTILIRARTAGRGNTKDKYRIVVVSGDSGEETNSAAYRPEDVIADKTIQAGKIKDRSIILNFPTVFPGKNEAFRIIVTNLSTEGKGEDGLQSTVRFGTRLCYVMDEYKGNCVVKGRRHAGDLLIRVSNIG